MSSNPSETPGRARTAGSSPGLFEAAERLLRALTDGREPAADDFVLVTAELRRNARRVFPDLDADDVVQATMARLLKARQNAQGNEIDNAWAYLLGSTRYAALDEIRVRRRRREMADESVPEMASPDDPVASLLDQAASQQAVIAALSVLVDAGDATTIQIITAWLDLAEELGRAPSTREAAAHARVSHTSVATALRTFKETLAESP